MSDLLIIELDSDGYPTSECIQQIKTYSGSHRELMRQIAFLFGTYGRCEAEGNVWRVATGGWSGCEEVIAALKENTIFWVTCWKQSSRGGGFEFETKT